MNFELEKVKLVNECLKVKVRVMIRKNKEKEGKLKMGDVGSSEEFIVELSKVC